jgi:hypothetical protein
MIINQEANHAFLREAQAAVAAIKQRLDAIKSPDGYGVVLETIEHDKIRWLEKDLHLFSKGLHVPDCNLCDPMEPTEPGFEVRGLRKLNEVLRRVEGALRARIQVYHGAPALAMRDAAVRDARNWPVPEEVASENAMTVNTMMALAWAVAHN